MTFEDVGLTKRLVMFQNGQEVLEFIRLHCSSYGKAKIVLKSNQYFIEANDRATMNKLISFPCINKGIRNA